MSDIRKDDTKPRIIIIGAGFGGLYAAKKLSGENVRVTLIDRNNHHLFQPLLYQVATAALSPAEIAQPIRYIFRNNKNIEVLMAEVKNIDVNKKKVITENLSLPYDYLIVATGARHSYFGHNEWEKNAPGLKNLEDALDIRRRILLSFEKAEMSTDLNDISSALTFIIVGGGPTGVELAGAIAEISRYTMAKDFRSIDPTKAKVILIEGLPRLLSAYPEDLSEKAKKQLETLGVKVMTNTRVTQVDKNSVKLNGETIKADTILWAAGNMASSLGKSLGVELDKAGRVMVNPDLTIPNHPEIQVIGDLAHCKDEKGNLLPGTCPVAIQEGKHAAENILNMMDGKSTRPFKYFDKGSMATIGRHRAVADLNFIRFSGFLAWLSWLFIHLITLIGFRNKFVVLFSWFWAYITFGKGARLITGYPGYKETE